MRFLPAILMSACASAFAPLDVDKLPSAKDYPGVAAVRLLDETTLDYGTDSSGEAYVDVTTHERLRVLESGHDELGRLRVHYRRAFNRVLTFDARVIKPNGEVKHYTLKDLDDVPTRASFVMYADSRALSVDVPATAGTIIEWRSVVRNNELRLWPQGQAFASRYPLEQVALRVRHPKTWKMNIVEHRSELAPLPAMQRDERDDHVELSWRATRVQAIPADEASAPGLSELAPVVMVHAERFEHAGTFIQAATDEQTLSRWLFDVTQQLAPVGAATPAEVRALAESIVTANDRPRDKARKLYNWVRDNVSYCAIEIGMGGFRPHAAEDVLRLKYGDCKDKANLLRRLLMAVGVESELTLIHSHAGLPKQRLTLTGGNFNHAILAVKLDDGYVLTDPTSRTAPFGRLPQGDQGSPCLRLSATGATFERAPELTADQTFERVTIDLAATDGGFAGTLTLERDGVLADHLRNALLDASDGTRPNRVATALRLAQDAEVSKLALPKALAPEAAEPLSLSGRVSLPITGAAASMLRPSSITELSVPKLPGRDARTLPLLLGPRRRIQHTIRIALGDRFDIGAIPPRVALESEVGRYALELRRDKNALFIERSLTLETPVLARERYAEARRFFDDVIAAEARPIILKRKNK